MFLTIPGESFEHLVARVQGTAFIMKDDAEKKLKRAVRRHRLVKAAELFSPKDNELLLQLLEGAAFLIQGYVFTRTPLGYTVRSSAPGSAEHTIKDGACSCPDSRFRERKCKHLLMLEKANGS